MTLGEAREGTKLKIIETGNEQVDLFPLRFGVGTGAMVEVEKNIRGGPVIISRNQMELAIGREIADAIKVESI